MIFFVIWRETATSRWYELGGKKVCVTQDETERAYVVLIAAICKRLAQSVVYFAEFVGTQPP
jgi:hypothetical protein